MRLPLAALAALVLVLGLAGSPAPAQDVGTKIVGGTTAEAGEYPWQIALYRKQGSNLTFRCGGTLIADTVVVTAAHCTDDNAQLAVRVGSHSKSSSGTVINVSGATEHPDYNSSTLQYDASVLVLNGSGTAANGEPLQLIGEEGSADDALWAPGDMLAISGWGTTSSGSTMTPDQLREARVPRVADSTCGESAAYGGDLDPATMVCAGFEEGGVDTCQGDSGGPLVASTQDPLPPSEDDPSQWRLVGITSWGEGCALPDKPGVYTRVAAPDIRDWILGLIGPPAPTHTLTVTKNGTGTGTVTSNPAGISCGSGCLQSYTEGTAVTLTAAPSSDSTFSNWGGACSGSATTCVVTMSEAKTVTATFTQKPQHGLTVSRDGTGTGTVTSNPSGVSCGSDCSQSYTEGTAVTLTAAPGSDSTFSDWGGACSGSATTCVVTMSEAKTVTATFTQKPPQTLTVSKTGDGSGTVTSSPAGIACGFTCANSFNHGTVLTLTATAASASTFVGWSGGGCSGTGTCQVTMTAAQTVTASFALTNTGSGTGTGTGTGTEDPLDPRSVFAPIVDTVAPRVTLPATRLKASRTGYLRLPVACPSGEADGCEGRITLRLLRSTAGTSALRIVAKKRFDISAGTKKRIRMRLSRHARKRLARRGRIAVRAIVVLTDPAGNSRTIKKKLAIRPR